MAVNVLKEVLNDIGLRDPEATVYLCLLEHGTCTASEIADKTGMYRPYVYDNLNKLMERGLVGQILLEGKKKFRAADPAALETYMEEKMDRIRGALPDLSKLKLKVDETAVVEVYRGKNAVKKAFRDIMRLLKQYPDTIHLGMGIDDEFFIREDPLFSKWFIGFLERDKIEERMITFEGAIGFAGGKTTKYRFIPREFFNPTNILIDRDLVTFILWTDPRYVIKITSPEFADSYRKQFELMWRSGKKRGWRQTKLEELPAEAVYPFKK